MGLSSNRLHCHRFPCRRARGFASSTGRAGGHLVLVGAVLLVAGCGTTSLQQTLGASIGATAHPEPPVEIYSRIARGALSCWFGAKGSLKKNHVFHADVAPPSAGGEVEIVLHERDVAAQSPRSLRSFRISILRSGDGSNVRIENLRFPEPMGREMTADVVRWANGSAECSVIGIGGWGAKSQPGAEPAPPAAKAKAKVKSKPAPKKQ